MEGVKIPFWGRISSLWLALAPVCAMIYVFSTTVSPNDFWWHAAAGRLVAQSGQIPTTNHFSWAMPQNAPYVYQNWLAEWLIYQVLRIGGISAIVVWRSASVGIAFAIIGLAAQRRTRRTLGENADEAAIARSVAFASLLSLAMIAFNLDARPQTFALPFFALVVFVLMEWPFRGARFRLLCGAALAALTALWANFHGSFFLAPLAFLVAFAGEEIGARIPALHHDKSARHKSARRALALVCGACLGAISLNPLGFGIFSYVARLSTNSTIQKSIYEWQAPSLRDASGILFYVMPLLLILITRIAARKNESGKADGKAVLRLRGGETLLLLVLFAMGARNMRSILWFALLFAPLFATCVAVAFSKSTPEFGRTFPTRTAQIANALLLALLFLELVPMTPRFKSEISWPDSFRARFAPTPRGAFPAGFASDPELLLDRATPVAAAEYLRARPPRKLWNDMAFGSYLMWALPDVKLGADPRIELYPTNYWRDYLGIAAGDASALRRLDELKISDVLCDPQAQAGLLRRLRASPQWRQAFRSRDAVLMRRA